MSEDKKDRTETGVVTSAAMNKTVTVKIERKVPHPLYKKYIRRTTKLHAHDEDNQCKVGDIVTIKQCRPLSKSKSWTLVKIEQSSAA
jgi:small subunit ribosomal protein S17